jgi:uncharacterized membrane protein
MFEIVVWLLGSIGMTNIIVESDIARLIKDKIKPYISEFLMKGLNCYQCTGFWSGAFTTTLLFICNGWELNKLCLIFLGGCATSFLATFFAFLQTYLEANSVISD